jgi:hypothetical protein
VGGWGQIICEAEEAAITESHTHLSGPQDVDLHCCGQSSFVAAFHLGERVQSVS